MKKREQKETTLHNRTSKLLRELKDTLPSLPEKPLSRALSFVGKRIDIRLRNQDAEGQSNEPLSLPWYRALTISCVPLFSIIMHRVMPDRKLRPGETFLAVLTSPLWFLGLLLAEVLMLGLCAAIWCLAFAVYTVDLAAGVGFILSLVSIPLDIIQGGYVKAVLSLLLCAVLGFLMVLLFAASIAISQKISGWCVRLCAAIKTKITRKPQ